VNNEILVNKEDDVVNIENEVNKEECSEEQIDKLNT
jgi:hypothetical protein